ncbi:MAG: DoxX family protein [Gemmatimonadales bacterium]
MTSREDLGKLLLRLALGGVLLFHGVFKVLNGVEWIKQPLASLGLPGELAYGTYLAEIVAPLLVIAGWKARVAALVIAVDMIMAGVLVLRPRLFATGQQGGGWAVELEALILFSALAVFLLGSGRYGMGKGKWD